MSNKLPCGRCEKFWAIMKGNRDGSFTEQTRGHCLDRSIYPKDKPGNPVFPPGAKIEELPNNVAKIHVVHKDQVETSCNAATEKRGKK